MRRGLAYGSFCLLDHGIWLLIQLLPGTVVIHLARRRPWRRLSVKLSHAAQQRWQARIIWLLRHRCRRAGRASTCLSRSLSGRLLLDTVGAANELHLAMMKLGDGRKVPHAWLVETSSQQAITPSLTPVASGHLIKL